LALQAEELELGVRNPFDNDDPLITNTDILNQRSLNVIRAGRRLSAGDQAWEFPAFPGMPNHRNPWHPLPERR
jgi:hypothetical protein